MAGEKRGQITSSDDGTQVPDANGFTARGPFDFEIVNGTTISAALQKKTEFGNWVTIPDSSSNTTLTAAAAFSVNYQNGGTFRIDVTTATGTWDWTVREH